MVGVYAMIKSIQHCNQSKKNTSTLVIYVIFNICNFRQTPQHVFMVNKTSWNTSKKQPFKKTLKTTSFSLAIFIYQLHVFPMS